MTIIDKNRKKECKPEWLRNKDGEIIYFPYTQSTSNT